MSQPTWSGRTIPILSLDDASAVYQCASRAHINLHRVKYPDLTAYASSLRRLSLVLGDNAEVEPWPRVLARSRRYLYQACSSALPFCHTALHGDEVLEELEQLLSHVKQTFPGYQHDA